MKTKPDVTFENAARAAGAQVSLQWEMRGQPAWVRGYLVNGRVAIVVTHDERNWDVFTPWPTLSIDESIKDALTRCGVTHD